MSEPLASIDGNGNGSASSADDPELRALHAELKLLESNVLLARMSWAQAMGYTFDDARDMYGVLGYRSIISTAAYRAKYARGGIAGRIVDALPNACWRGAMEIIENETKETYTPFEQAWHDFDQRLQVQAKLQRVDKLAGLSTYAVLLIGHRDGNLETELPHVTPLQTSTAQIIYLTPFTGGGGPTNTNNNLQVDRTLATDADATIDSYDLNVKSPRFGLPQAYRIKRLGPDGLSKTVHWSRVLHVAEGLLDDDVFGQPALERVWNLIEDLEKVTGGGAEAFWLRANQGIHVDIDKDMALDATKDTIAALKEQVEAYKHGLDRWLRTRGANVNVLGSDVANFASPADAILTQIAGAKGIPKRVLTGSEMGELASSQDRDNWKDQINGRQTGYLGPYVVRPLVDRLITYGYLPTPAKGADAYEVVWPHIQTLTEQEKAQGAQQWASVNATMGEPVFTEAEIRDKWYAMPPLSDKQRQEIADRNAEKLKQQQEAMAATAKPAPEGEALPPALVKAAARYVPPPGDEELVDVLTTAIAENNEAVVSAILGVTHRNADAEVADAVRTLGDYVGHPFHGNQWTEGYGGSELPSSGPPGRMAPGYENRIPHEHMPNPPRFVPPKPETPKQADIDHVRTHLNSTPMPVTGGHIIGGNHVNDAWKVTTPDGNYLFKPEEGEDRSIHEDEINYEDGPTLAQREVIASEIAHELGLDDMVPEARLADLVEPTPPKPAFPSEPLPGGRGPSDFALAPPESETPTPEHSGVIADTIGGTNAQQRYDAWGRPIWYGVHGHEDRPGQPGNLVGEPSSSSPSSSSPSSGSGSGSGRGGRGPTGQHGALIRWINGHDGYDADSDGSTEERANLAVFDAIIGNKDRHGHNYMLDNRDDGLIAIDHGYSFPDVNKAGDDHGGGIRNFVMGSYYSAPAEPGKAWADRMVTRIESVDWDRFLQHTPLADGEAEGVKNRIETVVHALRSPKPMSKLKSAFSWYR